MYKVLMLYMTHPIWQSGWTMRCAWFHELTNSPLKYCVSHLSTSPAHVRIYANIPTTLIPFFLRVASSSRMFVVFVCSCVHEHRVVEHMPHMFFESVSKRVPPCRAHSLLLHSFRLFLTADAKRTGNKPQQQTPDRAATYSNSYKNQRV